MSHRSYLFSLEQFGIKLGLEQIRALNESLGRPSAAFRSIVVAGTNGKGSVTAMIERGLRAAGLRTGRYTSPHLVHLEERFAIGGQPVSPGDLDESIGRVRDAAQRLAAPPSYFEATTAAAFDLFREAAIDVAVLEVGLGGRLDATNIVEPMAVAITAVDFDHEAHLGNTIQQIAREKAGVIKPGTLAVLGNNPADVRSVVEETSRSMNASIVHAPDDVTVRADMVDGVIRADVTTPRESYRTVTLALRGRHQVDNVVTAIRLLEEISARGLVPVSPQSIVTAVEDVEWPARLELVRWRGREVLIDAAHNPGGARALADYLGEVYRRPLPMVVGVMRDKKIDQILSALVPAASHIFLTAADSPRAAPPSELAAAAARVMSSTPASIVARPIDAVEQAVALGSPVVVAGSLYLAGEIRELIT